jgi:hypothetical protein
MIPWALGPPTVILAARWAHQVRDLVALGPIRTGKHIVEPRVFPPPMTLSFDTPTTCLRTVLLHPSTMASFPSSGVAVWITVGFAARHPLSISRSKGAARCPRCKTPSCCRVIAIWVDPRFLSGRSGGWQLCGREGSGEQLHFGRFRWGGGWEATLPCKLVHQREHNRNREMVISPCPLHFGKQVPLNFTLFTGCSLLIDGIRVQEFRLWSMGGRGRSRLSRAHKHIPSKRCGMLR